MAMDFNEVIIGFDLGRNSSVLTFYHQNNTEPKTVSAVAGEEKYQRSEEHTSELQSQR